MRKQCSPLRRGDEVSTCLPRELHPRAIQAWADQARHCRKPEFLHERSDRPVRRLYRRRWHLGARQLRRRYGGHERALCYLQLSPDQQSLQWLQPDPDTGHDMGSVGNATGRAARYSITIQRAVVISTVVAYRLLDVEPDLGVESTQALGIRRDNAAGLSQQGRPTN